MLHYVLLGITALTVTYNCNGCTGGFLPDDSTGYRTNEQVTVKEYFESIGLRKFGFKFIRWNTEADGNGDSYNSEDTFYIGKNDVDLYAQWEPQ